MDPVLYILYVNDYETIVDTS